MPTPREGLHVDSAGQRVALIVIEKEIVVARRREVREAAGESAAAFHEPLSTAMCMSGSLSDGYLEG
jgi:hypothetical protein